MTRGEIKHVDGHLSFRSNEGDFDVAPLVGKPRTDAVQKPGAILRDDLKKPTVSRRLVVKVDAGLYL